MVQAVVRENFTPLRRRVPVDRPWVWLQRGWQDMRRAPAVTIVHGVAIILASYVLLYLLVDLKMVYLWLPLSGAFFLVAPFLACAFYETSRKLERGESLSLGMLLAVLWRRPQILAFGGVLLLIHLIWVRVALLLLALFSANSMPGLGTLGTLGLMPENTLPFLLLGTVIGGLFAAVTFAISVISMPMLLDRDCDVATAMILSVRSALFNWQAMALWAALIVVFVALGMATAFVGLAISLPLLGHASWHAYRDLVE